MQNKGCLIAILGVGALCAFLFLGVIGILGAFTVKRVEVNEPFSRHATYAAAQQTRAQQQAVQRNAPGPERASSSTETVAASVSESSGPFSGQVSVTGTGNISPLPLVFVPPPSRMAWREVIIVCVVAFPLGLLVAIVCVALFLRNRRKPRSCCASAEVDDANEIQQMYAGFKRMEQRLQTLETILTDKTTRLG